MDCSIVGCGAVATEYAEAFGDDPVRLAAVCDLDRDRAESIAARAADAGNSRPVVYTGVEELLAAEDTPLVCVLTDHASHAAITRTALAADRHVFSQKPLATDAETARELVRTAADRDLALGCAPISPRNPAQRRLARTLVAERAGRIRLGYAHAHVGRVTRWHDRPASFLSVGPLYDGAVYPLTNLTAWFGPVERVRTADAVSPWPPEGRRPDGPTHYEATMRFASGSVVRLTASFYAPHRSREFTTLELHGDEGSIYLADAGALDDEPETVQFGPLGEEYAPVESASGRTARLADGPERLAAAVERGERPRRSAHRGAHVVSVCEAIERAAAEGGPIPVTPPAESIESLSSLAAESNP